MTDRNTIPAADAPAEQPMTRRARVAAALADPVSLAALRAAGFTGGDASLRISLEEYGLAWAPLDDGADDGHGAHIIVYGVESDKQSCYTRFASAEIRDAARSPIEEWTWVTDWSGFGGYCGCVPERETVLDVLQSALGYWGYENLFGSSYHRWAIQGVPSD